MPLPEAIQKTPTSTFLRNNLQNHLWKLKETEGNCRKPIKIKKKKFLTFSKKKSQEKKFNSIFTGFQ